MICFKGMTFCLAKDCLQHECRRHYIFTAGNTHDLPVSVCDFSNTCEDYMPNESTKETDTDREQHF